MDDVETYTFFFVVPDTSFKEKFKMGPEKPPVGDSGRLDKVKYMLLSIPVSRPQARGSKRLHTESLADFRAIAHKASP